MCGSEPKPTCGALRILSGLNANKSFSWGGGCSRNAVYYPGKFSGHETKEHPFIVKPSVTAELNKQAA